MIVDFHTHVDEAEIYGWLDPPEKPARGRRQRRLSCSGT